MRKIVFVIVFLCTTALLFGELITPVSFQKFHSKAGTKAKYRTDARVSHDGEALVFELNCEQPKESLTAVSRLHDRNVYKDDSIEVYIDAAREGKDYMQFIVNPLGTIQDLRFREWDWDSSATATAEISENAWKVTLRVPFAELAPYCAVKEGDVMVNINICRSLHEKADTYVSLLEGGAYGQKEHFIPLRLAGVSATILRSCYEKHLAKQGIDVTSFANLAGAEYYDATQKALRQHLTSGRKVLPDGVLFHFASPTNVIPNPNFEYLDKRGRIANWLKRGEGVYLYKDGVLEMSSTGTLELWQANEPFLDNTRVYSLRGKVKSISGNNRFRVNLTGLDRSVKAKEITVASLESPQFANTGDWQDVVFEFELPKSAFKGDVGLVVEQGSLLVKEVELDLLGKEDAEIIVNQLGYRPDGYKDAIIWSRKGGLSEEFELWDGERCTYRGKAKRLAERQYGREVFVADFSDFKKAGAYCVKSNGMTSHTFKLGPKVYEDGIRFLLDGLYLQRQGFKQEGWKQKPDYMDDATLVSNEARGKENLLYLPDGRLNPKYILGHRDLTGGWRDAGDDSKQPCSSSTIYSIARDLNGVGGRHPLAARLADELMWGVVNYTDKLYMGDGTFLYPNITVTKKSFWYGRAPDECTDGIPGTEDDRVAFVQKTENGYTGETGNQWVFYEALGMAALAFRDSNPQMAEKCTAIMAAYYVKLQELFEKEGLETKQNWNYADFSRCAAKIAYVALYLNQLTGKASYKLEAERMLSRIIDLNNKLDYAKYDTHRPFFATLHYFNVMLEYAELFPNEPLVAQLKPSIKRYVEGMILPGYDLNALFPVFDHRRLCRHYGRPCMAIGITAESTLCAVTLLRAGRILGTDEYAVLAEKTLQFWMGRNPQNICEVSGMGWRFVAVMSGLTFCPGHEDGVIKGMMANGFRYLSYMPLLSKPVSCNPGGTITTNYGCEVYQKPTAYAIMLMGELERSSFVRGVK